MYISQQIAAIAVSNVLAGRNLTQALPEALSSYSNATAQQRGAAADLSYGTLRFYGEINAYLEKLLEKPLSNQHLTALLLVAIYQLLHDKADDFTVVNQAVKAASYAKPKWAKGLVNGVLRNFLRQKASLAKLLKADDVAFYSYPQWWIHHLQQQYPNHWQAMLEAGNQHPPMTLRINTHKISVEAYLQLLARQGIDAYNLGGQAVVLTKPVSVEKVPGFVEGIASIQDYGAQLAAQLLDVKDGMHVLDACCAPGGKTGHVLELAQVEMTAIDNDSDRLQRVQSNLDRLQLKAILKVADASKLSTHDNLGQFDRILADVPCSASGIVRRHVDIKWLRRAQDIATFSAQQARILQELWQLLAKGGKLLYVTCSVFHEENQGQIEQFLKTHDDAKLIPLTLDHLVNINISTSHQGQLLPSTAHDGFFYALLQKK